MKNGLLWHYFGSMHRVFSKAESTVRKCSAVSKHTVAIKSEPTPVYTFGTQTTEDDVVFCSGTTRELRRLKRQKKAAEKVAVELSRLSGDALPSTTTVLAVEPALRNVDDAPPIDKVKKSSIEAIQNEACARCPQIKYCSECQSLKFAPEYPLTIRRFRWSEKSC